METRTGFQPNCACICLDFNSFGSLTYTCFDAQCSGNTAYLDISDTSYNGNSCSCSQVAYQSSCLGACDQALSLPSNANSCIYGQDDERSLTASVLLAASTTTPNPTPAQPTHTSGAAIQSELGGYNLIITYMMLVSFIVYAVFPFEGVCY
jgi:hypothetical protein